MILPSDFMRNLRPEYYSDSETRTRIELEADEFEYRLETITARNQTHDFELFCRKLCEYAICPDLRAQTGPEGGGDAKVDTETLPVSEKIRERYYQGIAKEGQEYWAIAISAQKKWSEKVRRDVQNIVETGRDYERIYFITSRHARARDRARIEKELSDQYGVRVCIHDRTWIVEETIGKDRKELAFNFLKVGREVESSAQLGPNDYSRTRQLEAIERDIKNPEAYVGMEMQLAAEALLAAKISRNLERNQEDTEGRFLRAIRLSEKYGTYRQQLEAKYEQLWSAFWYFDEFEFFFSEYAVFEELVLSSENAVDLEWLGNLHQCLVNSVVRGYGTEEQTQLNARTDRLERRLKSLADDTERPNNSLEARSGLLRIDLNRAMLNENRNALPRIWEAYSEIVEASKGMGEFNFDSLIRFIEVSGNFAGNDAAYNSLVENIAEVVGLRQSESEAALIYLNRATKMSLDQKYELVGWLGKAAIGLIKQERSQELVEAMYLLANAYRSAGLLWAARASCALAMATLFIEGDRENKIPVTVVPFMKLWAKVSIELYHFPDALHHVQLLNGMASGLPLDDASKERVINDLRELDIMFGGAIMNVHDNEITALEKIPDTLEKLDLFMARSALMYRLGHFASLREDGSLPDHESDDDVLELLSQLKDRFAHDERLRPLISNSDAPTVLETVVLGMRVTVEFKGCAFLSLAEAIIGSLEAFFASALIHRVTSHTEHFRIFLVTGIAGSSPTIVTAEMDKTTTVTWPSDLKIVGFENERDIRSYYTEIAGHVFGATCFVPDADEVLDQMMGHDAGASRISVVASFASSHTRIFKRAFNQLSDWDDLDPRRFELNPNRLPLPQLAVSDPEHTQSVEVETEEGPPRSHRHLVVRSIIDVQSWREAGWKGCGYLDSGPDLPPIMMLLFDNPEIGQNIFENWRERFGEKDNSEEISISFFRSLRDWNPHHYVVEIRSRTPNSDPNRIEVVPGKTLTMIPGDSVNIERFISGYEKFGVYAIIPGQMPSHPGQEPTPFFDFSIEKSDLNIFYGEEVPLDQTSGTTVQVIDPRGSTK
ncbi:MAG: tetratricopeptide repeat protein [Pseudomonadota bacterium]